MSLKRPDFCLPETAGGFKTINVTPCLTGFYGLSSLHRLERPDKKVAAAVMVAVKTTVKRSPNRKAYTKTRLN